jgi:hypothetical protein
MNLDSRLQQQIKGYGYCEMMLESMIRGCLDEFGWPSSTADKRDMGTMK